MMTTTSGPCPSPSFLPQAAPPRRSPRTSLILAELARQRRQRRVKRQRRRLAWTRCVGRLAAALFGRRPFEPSRTPATPGLIFPETPPFVYARHPSALQVARAA